MSAVVRAWDRFWFRPTSTASLGVFRIAYGALVTLWSLALIPDLITFFGKSAIVGPADHFGRVSAHILVSDAAVIAVFVVLLVSAVSLALGYHSRLAAALVFGALVLFQQRNSFVLNAGDRLISHLGFFLMLAPSGAALSIDRLRRGGDFWTFPERAPWPIRLIQVQVSIMYLATVWEKLQGHTWIDGTAVAYAWRIGDLARLPVPAGLGRVLPLVHVITWGTLLLELALGTAVWIPRLRPYVLALGVALHLSIEVTMEVGFFSYSVLVAYIAFVPADTMEAFLFTLRGRLASLRLKLAEAK